MTRRMIDSGMWSNENFAALPAMARLLQMGIINHADDQGRIKAHPAYLRSQIFPYDDVTIADVDKWLYQIAANGTILVYQADGKDYIQLLKWWDYQSLQYAAPSEYAAPVDWQDRIRYNAKGGMVLTYNWITTKGETLPDTCDHRGAILTKSPVFAPPHSPEKPGGNPPETPPVSINQDQSEVKDQLQNKDQDQSQGQGVPTAIDDLPQDEELTPKALIADLRQRRFMYLDKEATTIAARLIADYGWARVMEAADKAEAQHLEKIAGGTSGITAPLAYMCSILQGGIQQARTFPAQSMGEASVDKFFARIAAKGH